MDTRVEKLSDSEMKEGCGSKKRSLIDTRELKKGKKSMSLRS